MVARRRSVLNGLLRQRPSCFNAALMPNCHAKSVLTNLQNNAIGFNTLELDDGILFGCSYADLLRAISLNVTVTRVYITEDFLEELTESKIIVLLDLIRTLPNIEFLSMRIPPSSKVSFISIIYSALKKTTTIKCIEIHGLTINKLDDKHKLDEVINNAWDLRKLRLLDLSVASFDAGIDKPRFLDSLNEFPKLLEEVEIHVGGNGKLPDSFLDTLVQSESLQSLILRNISLESKGASRLFQLLECNCPILQRLEFWRCDLGPMFVTFLGSMIAKEKSLQTLVVSHVEFHGRSSSKFLSSLKNNKGLENLQLIPKGSYLDANTVEAACHMMVHNNALKSIMFQSDNVLCDNTAW